MTHELQLRFKHGCRSVDEAERDGFALHGADVNFLGGMGRSTGDIMFMLHRKQISEVSSALQHNMTEHDRRSQSQEILAIAGRATELTSNALSFITSANQVFLNKLTRRNSSQTADLS